MLDSLTTTTTPLSHRVLNLKDQFVTYYPSSKSTVVNDGDPRSFRVVEVVGCGTNKQGQEFARVLAFDYDAPSSPLVNRSLILDRVAFLFPAQPLNKRQEKKVEAAC